jgi:hypothetical protein
VRLDAARTDPEDALASNTSAARVDVAAVSMTGREAGLPISSSPLSTRRSGGCGKPAAARARTAQTACTSPAFMSNTPGPLARSPSTRNGQSARVPSGHTVS